MVTRSQTEPRLSDLEQGLRIDENNLDEALLTHPDFFYRISKQLALLISRRDEVTQEKKEAEARVDTELRHNSEVGNYKLTEPQIKNLIQSDSDIIKITEEFLELSRQVGQWSALKEAFVQRSYMLKSLCELYISNYFGSTTEGSSARMKDYDAETNRREMDRLRRQR